MLDLNDAPLQRDNIEADDERSREPYVRTDDIKRVLEGRAADIMRAAGVPWHGRDHINCPYHDHPDRNPSWRVMEDGTRIVCTCRGVHSVFDALSALEGLSFEDSKIRAAELLGRADLIVDPNKLRDSAGGSDDGVTLEQLADMMKLSVEELKCRGWFQMGRRGERHNKFAVGIWYRDRGGKQSHLRLRLKLVSKKDKFRWKKGHVNAPLYGAEMAYALPSEGFVVLVEGESDCVTLWHNGFPALGLPGAGNWNEELHAPTLDNVPAIFVIIEQDAGGASVLKWLARSRIRERVRLVTMPEGVKDPRDLWLQVNADRAAFTEAFRACLKASAAWDEAKYGMMTVSAAKAAANKRISEDGAVTYRDFVSYGPQGDYIFVPTGGHWPKESVNRQVEGLADDFSATDWADLNQPVQQKTWAPGFDVLIRGKLMDAGGWIERSGFTCFNSYRPPQIVSGDPNEIAPWLDHIKSIFPGDWGHIVKWLAHRVQYPGIKINHILVLGGDPGIGKDTIIEPVKYAVGEWNVGEISASSLTEPFNEYVRNVILRISEARDFGELNRYQFYDHMKIYAAAPPDVLRVNEKHTKAYPALNVMGVVLTTNYLEV